MKPNKKKPSEIHLLMGEATFTRVQDYKINPNAWTMVQVTASTYLINILAKW